MSNKAELLLNCAGASLDEKMDAVLKMLVSLTDEISGDDGIKNEMRANTKFRKAVTWGVVIICKATMIGFITLTITKKSKAQESATAILTMPKTQYVEMVEDADTD